MTHFMWCCFMLPWRCFQILLLRVGFGCSYLKRPWLASFYLLLIFPNGNHQAGSMSLSSVLDCSAILASRRSSLIPQQFSLCFYTSPFSSPCVPIPTNWPVHFCFWSRINGRSALCSFCTSWSLSLQINVGEY